MMKNCKFRIKNLQLRGRNDAECVASSINLMVVAGSHYYEHNIDLFVMHAHYQTLTLSHSHFHSLIRNPTQLTTHTTQWHKNYSLQSCRYSHILAYHRELSYVHTFSINTLERSKNIEKEISDIICVII